MNLLRNPAIWPLLLVNFVGALGFTITLPLTPYYAATFGADPFLVGLLSASYAIFAVIAGPILGRLSDRQGRRPWLIFSQLGTLVGFIITAIGGALWVLFLGRIIDGISGGNQVIAQAYLGDVTKPAERTQAYGLMGATFGLGAIVGPVLGGALSVFGYAVPFWVAAGISAVSLLATWRFLPESRPADGPTTGGGWRVVGDGRRATESPATTGGVWRAAGDAEGRHSPPATPANPSLSEKTGDRTGGLAILLRQPDLRRLLVLFGVMALVMGMFVASIGLFMQLQLRVSPAVAGMMVAYYGVLTVAAQVGLVGRLARRFGEAHLLAPALLSLAVAMGILFVATTIPMSLLSVTFLVFGIATLRPSLVSLVSQVAGPERQGLAMGAVQSIEGLTQIVTPILSGLLIDLYSPGTPGIVAAAIALAGLAYAITVRPQQVAVAGAG